MMRAPGLIDVWWGTHSDLEPHHEYYLSVLSKEESARMQAYRIARRGRTFALIRGWVRTVLATYTGDAPARLPIGYEASGKPVLIQPSTRSRKERLEFNVSHADNCFALAVTRGSRLGLDVERIRQIDPMDTIARMFFSESDYQALLEAEEQRVRRFFELWTQLEARYKAFGSQEAHNPQTRPLYNVTWEPAPGYIASLTCEREDASLRWIPWKGVPVEW